MRNFSSDRGRFLYIAAVRANLGPKLVSQTPAKVPNDEAFMLQGTRRASRLHCLVKV